MLYQWLAGELSGWHIDWEVCPPLVGINPRLGPEMAWLRWLWISLDKPDRHVSDAASRAVTAACHAAGSPSGANQPTVNSTCCIQRVRQMPLSRNNLC